MQNVNVIDFVQRTEASIVNGRGKEKRPAQEAQSFVVHPLSQPSSHQSLLSLYILDKSQTFPVCG